MSAALAGAAGLGAEVLLLSSAGLSLGYGRSGVIGLAVWVAGWAVGAWWSGRSRLAPAALLLAAGVGGLAAAPLAMLGLLALGTGAHGAAPSAGLALLALATPALLQGLFLPQLARIWRAPRATGAEASWLFALNLAGAVGGALWIGHALPLAVGRVGAAIGAGIVALLAGLLGAGLARGVPPHTPAAVHAEAPGALGPRVAGFVVGVGSAWAAILQGVGLRLGALQFGGMQPALSATIAAALLTLAVGALVVPRCVPPGARGVGAVLCLCALSSTWFLVPRVAAAVAPLAREHGRLVAALWMLGPALLPFGALVPVLHRALAGESGRRLGGLLLHEAWGAALVVPFVSWCVVPRFGLSGALATGALLGLAAQLFVDVRGGRVAWTLVGPPVALVLILLGPAPARLTPALDDPAFRVLAFTEDADFAVTVVEDGVQGERALLTDGFRATATGDMYLYMRVLGHLPLVLHPAPARVGVLAFGTGTTAGAVALHPAVERLDVLELSGAVLSFADHFRDVNGGVLDDPRVRVHLGDGRRTLAQHEGAFDVLTMEPLLPDSPFAVYLYTAEFYARARRSLAPGGLLCQWVPPHALPPATFDAVVDAFARAFPWSGVFLFGSQVILIGGDAVPPLARERFDARGPLAAALDELGLESPSGALARFVTEGARWPRVERPLTDGDPWVIYLERPPGNEQLAWLPLNLRRLRGLEGQPPAAWRAAADPAAWARLDAARLLHRAREAWELERYGGALPVPADPLLDSFARSMAALAEGGVSDPEVRHLARLAAFDEARTAGFRALQKGLYADALVRCTRAVELRPERADVHLFLAMAAAGAGRPGPASKALRRALQLCPRLLETEQGKAAARAGFPPGFTALVRDLSGR
jgi:spermidine synthase